MAEASSTQGQPGNRSCDLLSESQLAEVESTIGEQQIKPTGEGEKCISEDANGSVELCNGDGRVVPDSRGPGTSSDYLGALSCTQLPSINDRLCQAQTLACQESGAPSGRDGSSVDVTLHAGETGPERKRQTKRHEKRADVPSSQGNRNSGGLHLRTVSSPQNGANSIGHVDVCAREACNHRNSLGAEYRHRSETSANFQSNQAGDVAHNPVENLNSRNNTGHACSVRSTNIAERSTNGNSASYSGNHRNSPVEGSGYRDSSGMVSYCAYGVDTLEEVGANRSAPSSTPQFRTVPGNRQFRNFVFNLSHRTDPGNHRSSNSTDNSNSIISSTRQESPNRRINNNNVGETVSTAHIRHSPRLMQAEMAANPHALPATANTGIILRPIYSSQDLPDILNSHIRAPNRSCVREDQQPVTVCPPGITLSRVPRSPPRMGVYIPDPMFDDMEPPKGCCGEAMNQTIGKFISNLHNL